MPKPSEKGEETTDLTLNFGELCCLMARSVVAWVCNRILTLCTDPGVPMSHAAQWGGLQRKITVSLLVNANFWGMDDSQQVLSAMSKSVDADVDVASLFQRARAEGIEATLPSGWHADEPTTKRVKGKLKDTPLVQHAAITEHARVNKPAPEWRRALVLSPPKPEPPPALFDPLAMYGAHTANVKDGDSDSSSEAEDAAGASEAGISQDD